MKPLPALTVLGLSKKEREVFSLVQSGLRTPLEIHAKSKMSRTAIYHILNILHARGLVKRYITHGKRYVRVGSEREISDVLYATKRELLNFVDGKEEVTGLHDSTVIIHRGVAALKKCFEDMFTRYRKTRFIGFQGTRSFPYWRQTFGISFINKINRLIKKNEIIVEGIIPVGWESDTFNSFGEQWVRDYVGRMANLHPISSDYFKHGGDIFIFRDSLYLISLRDLLIIEVQHSEITTAIAMLIRHVTDTTDPIDINQELLQFFEQEKKRQGKSKA